MTGMVNPRRLYGLLLLLFVSTLQAEMVPNAPVLNFKLPMFGDNGYKSWDLQGREGRYISPQQIDVIDMILRVFSGDEKVLVDVTIESPQATILIDQKQAQGDSLIKIIGPNYLVRGKDWIWQGAAETITVKQEVRVTFDSTLSDILR